MRACLAGVWSCACTPSLLPDLHFVNGFTREQDRRKLIKRHKALCRLWRLWVAFPMRHQGRCKVQTHWRRRASRAGTRTDLPALKTTTPITHPVCESVANASWSYISNARQFGLGHIQTMKHTRLQFHLRSTVRTESTLGAQHEGATVRLARSFIYSIHRSYSSVTWPPSIHSTTCASLQSFRYNVAHDIA